MGRDHAAAFTKSVDVFVNVGAVLMAEQETLVETEAEPKRGQLRDMNASPDREPADRSQTAGRALQSWLAGMAEALAAAQRLFNDQLPAERIAYDEIGDLRRLLGDIWRGMPTYVFDAQSVFKTCFESTATGIDKNQGQYAKTLTALMKVANPYHDFMELSLQNPPWTHQLEAMETIKQQANQSDLIRKQFKDFCDSTLPLVTELTKYVGEHLKT